MNVNKNDEKDIQRFFKAQKLALYWLLGLIYSAFIGLQLGRIQAIADINYSLHEIMHVPFYFALFIVPVLFLIYMYFLINYLRKRGRQTTNLKTVVQAIVVITSIIIVVSITAYQSFEVSTGGVFEVEQKKHEDRKYYLVLNDKKVRVSYNEFQLVEEKQQYLISFVWNKRSPNKGRLKTIEPIK
ncbi:hypothetical protein BKP37_09120 [Anaerobacillus alkalilacustris]|uniref:Uncharacterized protein n=1 Tax=Anaerobacillus alkalilacustris TaxID=393763 RepID=A0A1S2LNW9_9BACI|nr:hypothetical protein [Anaerobacillus alkalilacustris]OIJ14232.1 hypothetical protein BKP37_09120 [Anaerobacillus alkalilacustris]